KRHLLLVPALDPVGAELEAAVGPAERPPQRDVAALVVADARLRADVAEDDVDALALRRLDLGGRLEPDDAAVGVDLEVGRDRHGVAVGAARGEHRVANT